MEKKLRFFQFLLLPSLFAASAFMLQQGAAEAPAPAENLPVFQETSAVAPLPAELQASHEMRVYVDGTLLPLPGLSSENGSRHYAPAGEFLNALDGDFWAGEKETFSYAPFRYGGLEYLCVEDFCADWGISLYQDSEDARLWCTSAAGDWPVPEGYSVPALMYHGVGENLRPGAELVVATENLDRQLALLLERGYTPIWFEDLKHIDSISKPVLLTFDDGYLDNYTELFPLLQKYHVKATLFIVSGTLDNEHTVTREQIREMLSSGLVSIQCHTQYHLDLDTLSYEQQVEELCWSKVSLLELTNREPYVIAYPRGRQNDDTLAICRADYRFGVKMGGPLYITGEDPLLIHRVSIPRSMTLEEFAARFP